MYGKLLCCVMALAICFGNFNCGKGPTQQDTNSSNEVAQGTERNISEPNNPPAEPSVTPEPTTSQEPSPRPEPPASEPPPTREEPSTVPDASPPPEPRITPEPTPEPPPTSSCNGQPQSSGDKTWTLQHNGTLRTFSVFIPPQYNGRTRLPVVINYHGLNSNGTQQKLLTAMNTEAGKQGFIAVHPEGLASSWNGGLCCSPASALKNKDVEFTSAMIDELDKKLCINTKRIYATGISNGAYMAYRVGCELSEKIAAIAPVAGLLLTTPCNPKRPLSVIAFHGTADLIVPFNGYKIIGWPSVPDSIDVWVKHNGCNKTPQRVYNKGDTYCDEYSGCQGGTAVKLCVTKDGGHTWPGGFPIPGLGKTTQDISATEEGWSFLSKYQMP